MKQAGAVFLSDLMAETDGEVIHGTLKRQLERLEKSRGTVSKPLPTLVKERIGRSVAYQHASEEVGKWVSH